jgi:hypothetical protein
MENKDTPAYPNTRKKVENGCLITANDLGLTKREYFAGLAMQGLLASGDVASYNITQWAVEYADTLLEELEESK